MFAGITELIMNIHSHVLVEIYFQLILILASGFLSLWIIIYTRRCEQSKKDKVNIFTQFGFLAGLLLITVIGLEIGLQVKLSIFVSGVDFVERNLFYVILITATMGFITSGLDKERIIKDKESIKRKELAEEFEREKEIAVFYAKKFAFNDNLYSVSDNKALILFQILKKWAARGLALAYRLIGRLYIEGLWYSTSLIMILLLSAIIHLSIIGDYYFWTDEVFSFNAGKMILEKGEPLYDSGLYYGRASIYHYLMAGSMYLFGVNEFGSRVINIFINIFSALIIYSILKESSKKVALFGTLLFMLSNLTLVMTIETRFYGFFSLTFLCMAYSYYKVFIENLNGDFPKIIYDRLKKRRIWFLLFLVFTYISFNTHNFFFIIIFGLALYYFSSLLMDKSWQNNLIMLIGCMGIILAGAFYLTGTFNIYYAYIEAVTLDWAADWPRRLDYYVNIIQNNIPFYYVLLTLAIVSMLSRLSHLYRYNFAFLIAGLVIISPQRAVAERYMFFLIPFIFIVTACSFYYLYLVFRRYQPARYLTIAIVVVYTVLHLQLFTAEVNQEYHNGQLAGLKKLQFYEAMEVLDNHLDENILLLADYHAAFTLIAHSYAPDYIVISENRWHTLERGIEIDDVIHDHYFKIPFIIQETEEFNDLLNDERMLIVNHGEFEPVEWLKPIFEQRPRVYRNY